MSDGPPQGWATAPLDSLCQKFRGVSYGRDEASADPKKDYVPILRANNLQDDRLVFDDLVWVPERCVSDQQKLRTGDIVIAMSSGSKSVVGKTAQVMEDWRGSFGAFCGALRPWPELNSRYVGLFLRTREYRNTISELAAGSNINNLKNEHLAAIEVPVAPLAEQRRIVEKLEKLLGQVDACQQRLAKIPTLLKRFHQSVLAAACSGRLTGDWREENEPEESAEDLLNRVKVQRAKAMNVGNKRRLPPAVLDVPELPEIPEFWWWATLDQIVEEGRPIIYGIIKPGPHDPKGVPYVRVFEMKDGKVAPLSELKRASLERASKFTRATLKGGDLLISKDGTIGRVAIVPPELEGGNITQHLVRASIHPFLCRDYVACAIRSQKSQNWLFGKKKGVALQGVNVEDFRRLPLPIPPLAEQQEIVRRVEGLFALANQLEQRLAQARRQVDQLMPSLLARAFAGKLVPQDPTDEPAAVLLGKIKKDQRYGKQTHAR